MTRRKLAWLLFYVDKKNGERFIAAFPYKREAVQHVREGLGHSLKQYRIRGVDPASICPT